MKVLVLKRSAGRSKQDSLVDHVYEPGQPLEMLSRCDSIVVTVPLTGETRGLIAEPEFAVMKKSAVLINIRRGPTIDQRAMIKALPLDVFDQEPLPPSTRFYSMENVLLSPHCADHTPDWLDDAMRFFLSQLERFKQGKTLLNVVEKRLGY